MDNVNEIYVYENWKSDTPSLIGTLYVDGRRGKQVVSFEYDDEWLNDLTNNVTLDPDLRMFMGRQYAPADKLMFSWWPQDLLWVEQDQRLQFTRRVQQKVSKELEVHRWFVLRFLPNLSPALIDGVLLQTHHCYENPIVEQLSRVMGYNGEKIKDLGIMN